MLPELPAGVHLAPGRLTVEAPTAEALAEGLLALALVMRHDDRWRELVEPAPAPPAVPDGELAAWLQEVRGRRATDGAEEAGTG